MIPLRITCCLLLLLVGSLHADLVCKEPLYVAGSIKSGVPLAHTFTFTHQGHADVSIVAIKSSCGCLNPQLAKRRFRPGEVGRLRVAVNTLTQKAGPRSWYTRILYREGEQEKQLIVHVRAILQAEIRLDPAEARIYTSGGARYSLTLTDTRAKPMTVTKITPSHLALRAKLGQPSKTTEGRSFPIEVRLDKNYPVGERQESLVVRTDDSTYPQLVIPVTVVKRERPRIQVLPNEIVIDTRPNSPIPSKRILLRIPDSDSVTIESVQSSDPAIHCVWAEGPQECGVIRVRIDRKKLPNNGIDAEIRVRLEEMSDEPVVIPVRVR